MKNQSIEHDAYYHMTLMSILLVGGTLAILSRANITIEMIVISCTIFLYIARALLHHYSVHTLTSKIVIEYVVIGSLGMTILAVLLRWFVL